MKSSKLRYTMAAILGSLVAAVALTQAGCLRTQPSSADEAAPSGDSPSGFPNPAGKKPTDGRPAGSNELQQPLLREFGKALDNAPDLGNSDRNEAWRILKEADPILTRIKEENRRGIEEANRPPRIEFQRGKKPKPSENAPETEDQKQPKG